MNLSALGENALIARLTRGLPQGPQVRCGVGDDCAVLGTPRAKVWTLLKTDAVVEGIHFLPQEKMRRVGWKALCRNISDIAAMGGTPREALITLAAPVTTEVRALEELYAGLRAAAKQFGVSIVGGETSRSSGPLFISVALTGEVPRTQCVLRSTGQAGDFVYVTGRLGGSLAGKHLDFTPRLAEARWLVEHHTPRAMMDLSDGVGADLPRLAAASRCGYELWEEKVPRSRGCSVAQALGDGEDFELLLAMAPAKAAKLELAWRRRFPKLPLTRIGQLTAAPARPRPSSARGYDHFA